MSPCAGFAAPPAAAEPGPRVLSEAALDTLLQAARDEADGGHGRRLSRLSRRARLSGLLPRLRLGLRRGLQYDFYRDLSFEASGRSGEDEELTLDAQAVFELDRLVFAPEQVRLARARRRSEREVEERVREVIALVFELERGFVEQVAAPLADPAFQLQLLELQVLLDALTGGRFSELWEPAARRYRARQAASDARGYSRVRPGEPDPSAPERFDNASRPALERPP